MIEEDILRNPQKIIFIISLAGLFFSNLFQLIVSFIYQDDYDLIIYVISLILFSPQLILLIIFYITSKTCWKHNFFHKLLNTHLNRFLILFFVITISTISFLFGVIELMLIKKDDYNISFYMLLVSTILQIIFIFVFIIGVVCAFMNHSDKEILETANFEDFSQDFFRNPQKKIFFVSIIGIYSSTIPITLLSFIYYLNYDLENFIFSFINCILGLLQFLFVLIMLIVSKSCWKGNFFLNLIKNPYIRYTIILFGSALYILVFSCGILVSIELFKNCNYKKSILSRIGTVIFLVFIVIQFVSLIIFYVGLIITLKNKSDKEIIANTRMEIKSSLINDNNFGK